MTRDRGFSPNESLCVTADFLRRFVRQGRRLGYRFISLDELIQVLLAKKSRKFLAVTFDDGYIDNYEIAYPILKDLKVPFSIYVTDQFPEGKAVLWWYQLESLLRGATVMDLPDGRQLVLDTDQKRQAAFLQLRQEIMNQRGVSAEQAYQIVTGDHGADWQTLCARHAMQWNHLRELAADPLVTIGSHTVTHSVLSGLSDEQAHTEIHQSKIRIEMQIGQPVDHFCYPFGGRGEAGPREFSIARAAGFRTATTTRFGNLYHEHLSCLHALPRIYVNNDFTWLSFAKRSAKRAVLGRVVSV